MTIDLDNNMVSSKEKIITALTKQWYEHPSK